MNWNDLEKHFSPARLGRYRAARGGDVARAAADYSSNVLLSEAMVPLLNVLEIALRNGIHARLSRLYGRTDWWESWVGDPAFSWQNKEVANAKAKLARRHEAQTPDKVLAELTFGFWSSLFNTQFQTALWKDLRLVFARCPKPQRQRHNISAALNQIRDLRNRVFHHEPLLWLTPTLLDQHAVGVTVINWIDPQLGKWLGNHDRLPTTWADWVAA
ncbi:hypothetical protein [Pseudomonas aeruginosa]